MPSIQLKAIKPGKLPTAQEYVTAMKKAVYKSASLTLKDFEATVRTWTNKPTFDVTITEKGGDYIVTAGTDDKIFGYVDLGTPAHVIKPKRSKYLRFQSGYKSKGRFGVIGSNDGGAFGDPVFTTKPVNHPGFKGRKWTILIAKRRQTTIEQEINQAIAKVARQQK